MLRILPFQPAEFSSHLKLEGMPCSCQSLFWEYPNYELLTTFLSIFCLSKFLLDPRILPLAQIPPWEPCNFVMSGHPEAHFCPATYFVDCIFPWHLFPGACFPSPSQAAYPTTVNWVMPGHIPRYVNN